MTKNTHYYLNNYLAILLFCLVSIIRRISEMILTRIEDSRVVLNAALLYSPNCLNDH